MKAATSSPRLRGEVKGSLLCRHRADISHHRVEVVSRHRCVIVVAHRRLELAAILGNAGGDGALDVGVGPGTYALGRAGCDVARGRDAPRSGEVEASGAELAVEFASARTHRRVALHAVRD